MRYAPFYFALGLAVLVGCSDSSTSAARPSDSDVESAIGARLDTNPQLRDTVDVDANVDAGEVTLSGTVESQDLRSTALQFATDTQPELRVIDKIAVEPREVSLSEYTEEMATEARYRAQSAGDKIGSSLEDAWIHTKLTAKLLGDSDTPGAKINVDVMNKAVTLRGEVESQTAKQEAERIARETEGVKSVTNRLTVKG